VNPEVIAAVRAIGAQVRTPLRPAHQALERLRGTGASRNRKLDRVSVQPVGPAPAPDVYGGPFRNGMATPPTPTVPVPPNAMRTMPTAFQDAVPGPDDIRRTLAMVQAQLRRRAIAGDATVDTSRPGYPAVVGPRGRRYPVFRGKSA
jgi:hypothetical protein